MDIFSNFEAAIGEFIFHYSSLQTDTRWKAEWQKLLSQAELQLAIGTKTLPESLHSVPVSYVRDSEWLLLVVKIPLVAITPYEEFRVYPLPQKVNDKMLIINSLLFVSISVSKPTMTYFYESQLFIKLNDTHKIICQLVVKNGLKNLDCIATAVLKGGKPLQNPSARRRIVNKMWRQSYRRQF